MIQVPDIQIPFQLHISYTRYSSLVTPRYRLAPYVPWGSSAVQQYGNALLPVPPSLQIQPDLFEQASTTLDNPKFNP